MNREELFLKAIQEDVSILLDPNIAKIKNSEGDTPLHLLALADETKILKHPKVALVKNKNRDTSLHYLALHGRKVYYET